MQSINSVNKSINKVARFAISLLLSMLCSSMYASSEKMERMLISQAPLKLIQLCYNKLFAATTSPSTAAAAAATMPASHSTATSNEQRFQNLNELLLKTTNISSAILKQQAQIIQKLDRNLLTDLQAMGFTLEETQTIIAATVLAELLSAQQQNSADWRKYQLLQEQLQQLDDKNYEKVQLPPPAPIKPATFTVGITLSKELARMTIEQQQQEIADAKVALQRQIQQLAQALAPLIDNNRTLLAIKELLAQVKGHVNFQQPPSYQQRELQQQVAQLQASSAAYSQQYPTSSVMPIKLLQQEHFGFLVIILIQQIGALMKEFK